MDLETGVHAPAAQLLLAPPRERERLPVHCLPDVLRDNLDVVFVGTAAGRRSALVGLYYAGGGNTFWPALRKTEVIPERFDRESFYRLLDLGIGLTDLSKTMSGMDEDVVVTRQDLAEFDAKMRTFTPRAIAFTSKKAASLWLRRRTRNIRYGRQKRHAADFSEVFVLPSPSAAARRWWSIAPWQELADWLRTTAPWRF